LAVWQAGAVTQAGWIATAATGDAWAIATLLAGRARRVVVSTMTGNRTYGVAAARMSYRPGR
jgi:chitodextrinase